MIIKLGFVIIHSKSVLFTFQNLLWYCFTIDTFLFPSVVFLNFAMFLMVTCLFSSTIHTELLFQTQFYKGVVLGSLISFKCVLSNWIFCLPLKLKLLSKSRVMNVSSWLWCFQNIMKDKWMNMGYEEDELRPYVEPEPDFKDLKRIGENFGNLKSFWTF